MNKLEYDDILDGKTDETSIRQFLIDLAQKGETVQDLAALVDALRARMIKLENNFNCLDCCGTGGDGAHSLNVSTAVSFVVAGAGVKVAKHGNRAASSQCGTADVLEFCGIKIDAPLDVQKRALEEIGFCFLMAPLYHPALKPLSPIRKSIASRTIFNLTGPLLNPAYASFQLIGVFEKKWLRPMAETLKKLNQTKRALIVHSQDGLDEISLAAKTDCALLDELGNISEFTLTAQDFDLEPLSNLNGLKGGDAAYNGKKLLQLLRGEPSDYRQTVLANAAACFFVRGLINSFKEGVDIAIRTIDDGLAYQIFESYKELTQKNS